MTTKAKTEIINREEQRDARYNNTYKAKYFAHLKDENGFFDQINNDNFKNIKEWARGRGGTYKLIVETVKNDELMGFDIYEIKNNRLKLINK